jgi:signal transduction histidine kinase
MPDLKRNRIAAGNGEPERPVLTEMNGSSLRERDEILQELFEAKRKLQDYEQDRSNFAARVIHDVCVPLTAVQGYCGLLLAGELGTLNADQTQVIERMHRGLGKLWMSVEVIDDLGQPDQMSTRLKLGNATFEECLRQAMHEVLPVLEKNQISIKLEIEPPSGPLWLDSQKIEQVLVNLLTNSCKSSPRGSSVTVRARSVATADLSEGNSPGAMEESSKAYQIDIIDSGSEVDAECIDKMFDEHASRNDPMDRTGSGLGLAFCRMIVTAHKGHIWACPNGHGTTFSLLLPVPEAILESQLSRMAV